ncbi:rifin [Plasmodium reichenowi]|uniref:Rifin n=1 Tax=Plasmodium reichenowi TaxID=5854 RepID=A0A060RR99_PLARE|nr:rifin [Plasmodium reichenowi]
MKLHCSKILFFFLSLNILVTSSYAHNKNKPYMITNHTATTTSRVLSECDTLSSSYDKDEVMKSVKENFDRQTSQRFEEYDERMKEKRQKRKEERDKNIQEIIKKDKMDKSLEEKVEKCCLKCGCGLGGVAASVGLFGGLGTYGWKTAATAKAMVEGATKGALAGEAARIPAAIDAVIAGIETELGVSTLNGNPLETFFATTNYNNASLIFSAINIEYKPSLCLTGDSGARQPFCSLAMGKFYAARKIPGNVSKQAVSMNDIIRTTVETIVSDAQNAAGEAVKEATDEVIQSSIAAVDAKYVICQNAIIASVVAILVIVLVMIIIYLVLRYRRKKKMNKKAQYTKLLNQ